MARMIVLPEPLMEIAERAIITSENVELMRTSLFRDCEHAREDAEALIFLDHLCDQQHPSWPEFFIPAISNFLVAKGVPEGVVSSANADWLIEQIDHAGFVRTQAQLELVIAVMEQAVQAPESLCVYALSQIEQAMLKHEGPDWQSTKAPLLDEAQIELIRRILMGFGNKGSMAITKAEARILFNINDQTREAENHAAWDELFVKAIANFMMAASGYSVPPRAQALMREDWGLAADQVSGAMAEILSSSLKGFVEAHMQEGDTAEGPQENTLQEQMHTQWLAENIGRDGVLHENEKALLGAMTQTLPDHYAQLEELIETAA